MQQMNMHEDKLKLAIFMASIILGQVPEILLRHPMISCFGYNLNEWNPKFLVMDSCILLNIMSLNHILRGEKC